MWVQPLVTLDGPAANRLRNWHAGVIETHAGKLVAIHYRPWPRRISKLGVWFDQRFRQLPIDHCRLYWHRPWLQPAVLALDYVRSGPGTSVATFHRAVTMLDEIAMHQKSLVAVCHVTNQRISDRLLARWGWQAHCTHWSGRHFIRRYYAT